MIRPARWKLALLPLLIGPVLVACGSSDDSGSGSSGADGLSAVSISGDVGSAPKLDWKSAMASDATGTETLVEGDGPKLTADDTADLGIVIGNGYDKTTAYDSYASGGAQVVDLSSADTLSVFKDNLVGVPIGSRVAVAVNAKDVFQGAGNSSLGIGNEDPLVFVLDVLGPYTPSGSYPTAAKGTVPGVKLNADGEPEALVFDAAKPNPKLTATVISRGTGPVATKTSSITANYLGQVYGAKKPFDESYSKQPFTTPLSGVVSGWQKTLAGLPAGTRVMLSIPPKEGYGSKGQPSAGIKGTDTICFIIDILAVS